MAWSLEAEAEFSKVWDELLLLRPLHLGRAEVNLAIEVREEAVQAVDAVRETASTSPENPHQDEQTSDDRSSSGEDEEDIAKMLLGSKLFTQLLRKEITMTKFIDYYTNIRSKEVDEYMDKYIPKHI